MLGVRLKMFDDISDLPLQAISDDIGNRRIALIIDGLDSEKTLHPAPAFNRPSLANHLPWLILLKRLAEDGPRKGRLYLFCRPLAALCQCQQRPFFLFRIARGVLHE